MANQIKLGNLDISAFKVGNADCKVYLGDTLLYPTTPPTPPTFQGKWLATYTGGTTSSAECDSSSAITYNDINLTNLVSVEIGDCITAIGDNAFRLCTSLTSCTIGSGVTSIGESVFRDCGGLTSIDIPNSVTSIGRYAFQGCSSLASCTIGSGVTSIGDFAFSNCTSLTSITIEATTPPTIGLGVFGGSTCPIYVPAASLTVYQSAWSDYASRIQAIPGSYKWIATYSGGTITTAACDSTSAITNGEITLTDLVSVEIGDCVTSIGSDAFYNGVSLTSCTIPDSVTSIGNYSFQACSSLTSIDIPNSVTSIGNSAFRDCTGLTSLTIPDNVTTIGGSIIDGSGVKSMTVGSGVTSIDSCAFCCNDLTDSFTITAPNPPTINNCDWIFSVQCPIYVPSGSVNDYKNDQCWSVYAAGILPIPNS